MAAVRALMKIYSYLFHGALSLFLLGIALVSWLSDLSPRLTMLPWSGPNLTYWLLGGAAFGLLSVLLAMTGKVRALFFLWSLIVFGMIVWGYFLGPHNFGGKDGLWNALYLAGAALLALLGAWFQLRTAPALRR